MANSRDEEFSVRLTGLTAEMQERLRSALPGFQIESRDPLIAVIILRDSQDSQPICSFIEREALDPGSYSVWVSVFSSGDHDGLSLPTAIVDLIRATKGGVDFSFVACLGPDLSPLNEDAIGGHPGASTGP
jgi:hypothetical protein